LAREGYRLNRIVIEPFPSEVPSSDSVVQFILKKRTPYWRKWSWTNSWSYILPSLIQESAHEIIVPEYEFYHYLAGDIPVSKQLETLPERLRRRVSIVDRNGNTWKSIERFFAPLHTVEIEISTGNKAREYFGDGFSSTPAILGEFVTALTHSFYLLTLACKEQAEVDLSIERLKRDILFMRACLEKAGLSGEAMACLDQSYGLLNLYDKVKIPSIRYVAHEMTPSVEERLDELLREAEVISMSKERRRFGLGRIPLHLMIVRLGNSCRAIMKKRKYRSVAQASNEVIQIMSQMGYPLPKFPILDISTYSPPAVDLTQLRWEIATKAGLVGEDAWKKMPQF
jgi:hypothetical protein